MSDNSSNLASLSSTIKRGVDNRLKDLHTSMPGIVQSFNESTQLASVQPAIKRIFKTTNEEIEILTPVNIPILINVPVIYPRGGGFSMTFPVKKSDECLLIFSERTIDNWHQFGGVVKPGARRFHSLSDAMAIVGLSSMPNKIENYDNSNFQIKKDDGSTSITIKENEGIRLENSSGYVELLPNGKFDINGIIFGEHVHPQANDSGGNTEQPTGVPQ